MKCRKRQIYRQKPDQWLPSDGDLGDGNVTKLDCVMVVQLYKFTKKKSLNCMLKWVNFMECRLHLNKTLKKSTR